MWIKHVLLRKDVFIYRMCVYSFTFCTLWCVSSLVSFVWATMKMWFQFFLLSQQLFKSASHALFCTPLHYITRIWNLCMSTSFQSLVFTPSTNTSRRGWIYRILFLFHFRVSFRKHFNHGIQSLKWQSIKYISNLTMTPKTNDGFNEIKQILNYYSNHLQSPEK